MKEYMTIDELIEYFDISKSTLYSWRNAGLKVIKVFGKILFKADDVREFLDAHLECEYEA